jgi:hypothetical protein
MSSSRRARRSRRTLHKATLPLRTLVLLSGCRMPLTDPARTSPVQSRLSHRRGMAVASLLLSQRMALSQTRGRDERSDLVVPATAVSALDLPGTLVEKPEARVVERIRRVGGVRHVNCCIRVTGGTGTDRTWCRIPARTLPRRRLVVAPAAFCCRSGGRVMPLSPNVYASRYRVAICSVGASCGTFTVLATALSTAA